MPGPFDAPEGTTPETYLVTPIYLIQIPIETTCDPGTLLDIAIELGGQAAAEATECANSSLEATVDEQAILVRPAGLTSLERDLLAALKFMTAYAALHADGCTTDEGALVDVMMDPDNPGNVNRTIDMARAAIAKAGGAK